MATPRDIRKDGNDRFIGIAWNGFVDLCATEALDDLSPVQRPAALAFWYMSEVNNGGHFQYFVNKDWFDHNEVVRALDLLGAQTCSEILSAALKHAGTLPIPFPQSAEQFVEDSNDLDFSPIDVSYYERGDAEVLQCMERYLRLHEADFVAWID